MTELTRPKQQIWITRGHLAALAVATAAIAVMSFLVGRQFGLASAPTAAPSEEGAARYLPDASDEEALEGLLAEVERAQAELDQAQKPPEEAGFNRELMAEMPVPPVEGQVPSTVVSSLPAEPGAAPEPPDSALGAGAPSGGWAVQVASYAEQAEADGHVDRLKAQGMAAYRVAAVVSGHTWHRVRIGGYSSREAADAALGTLSQTLGLSDLMVAQAP